MKTVKAVAIALVLAMVSTPAFAGWVNDVKSYNVQGRTSDARNILQANMDDASISDADKLLKAGLTSMAADVYFNIGNYAKKNKTKAKAWYKLGMIRVSEGGTSTASCFNKAIANHPGKYDSKIGTALYQAGINAFTKGNLHDAEFFAKEVAKHGGSKARLMAEYKTRAITIARSNIQSGNIAYGKKMIDFARKNGYSSKQVHQMVIEVGHSVKPGQLMVDIYTYANELCSAKCDGSRKAGKRIADYARSIEDPAKFSKNIASMIYLAISMTDNGVEPYITVYKPGSREFFELSRGELSDNWISTTGQGFTSSSFFSNNKQYEVLCEDGSVVKIWKGEKFSRFNDMNFKIRAKDKTVVGLKVASR